MQFSILESFLIVLLIALIVTVSFRYLHLPIILGYLVAGILVGPHVLGWLHNVEAIQELAEFGVVLLMFTVGLQFSIRTLIELKYTVFILGGLQVLISSMITMGLALLIKMPWMSAIVVGGIVALSSTAIVVKQLNDQREVQAKHGMNAIGILLFQDLAVIPMLVLIATLSPTNPQPLLETMVLAFGKGIFAIFVILTIGRYCFQPLFRLISGTRAIELFTLFALFVAVGSAWVTNRLGISYALGAFLAGIMLGDTEFKSRIQAEIRPFRDVLLGLFFITVGMLVNVTTWPQTWHWIGLLLLGLTVGKGVLIILLARAGKNSWLDSTRTGLLLAQGSEFGFAILTLALANHVLPPDWGQSVLAALLLSLGLAPIIIRYNHAIAKKLTIFG